MYELLFFRSIIKILFFTLVGFLITLLLKLNEKYNLKNYVLLSFSTIAIIEILNIITSDILVVIDINNIILYSLSLLIGTIIFYPFNTIYRKIQYKNIKV